jgi:hypothetical protein
MQVGLDAMNADIGDGAAGRGVDAANVSGRPTASIRFGATATVNQTARLPKRS